MTIEEQLKELIIKKFGSVNKFAQTCGLPTSTVATIFTRGVNKTNVNTIIKICQQLEIRADELADGKIVPKIDDYQKLKTMIFNGDISKLNEPNQARLMSYYQALLDTQEGTDEST
jgi:DNA-binding Xre family transcriptional regulator